MRTATKTLWRKTGSSIQRVSNPFRRVYHENPKPILLVGNYPLDRQESMIRFSDILARNLAAAGVPYEVVTPRPTFGRLLRNYSFSGSSKWLGYLDKYVLFPGELSRRARRGRQVHITDHSNAMYARKGRGDIVTCHDLLAVRGALGEDTDCPASITGRALQRWILRGLGRAGVICCVSRVTANDVERLLPKRSDSAIRVVPNAMNYPYGQQSAAERMRLLGHLGLAPDERYILHVGSNLVRKNKVAVLKAMAAAGDRYSGRVVFAGPPLPPDLKRAVAELGLKNRVEEIIKPDNPTLEALYGGALALMFPSRWEGFGWPIIEAQACGCPVICSNQSALPEVAGGAAILCPPDDYGAWAHAWDTVARGPERAELIAAGLRNVARYSQDAMMSGYFAAYASVATRAAA